MKPQTIMRLWHHMQREVLKHRLPHGLLGPAYLWPGQDQRIRLHRRLWWQSGSHWPRLIWCCVEAFLWLRWVFCHAIPACRRVTRRLSPAVEAEEGISRNTQARRILKLALLWSIPPAESYQYKLYREPHKALEYVFMTETQAYHAWRNEALGGASASSAVIQDKDQLAILLSKRGIPVVSTIAKVTGNDEQTDFLNTVINGNGKVFCKMNSGNQGRGAFAAWRAADGLRGHCFSGELLEDTAAVEQAWKDLLQLDTVLIQPCLQNHPDLAPLAFNQELVTVRYISQWQEDSAVADSMRLSCLCATLEVPAGVNEQGKTCYTILPIHPETGRPGPAIKGLVADVRIRERTAHIESLSEKLEMLPGWEQLVAASRAAHSCFPDVRAIAWDWAVTPDGPLLLEGNCGWGCTTPQILRGGFIV